jgi:hypothetical protein
MKISLIRFSLILGVIGMLMLGIPVLGQGPSSPPEIPSNHGFNDNQGPSGAPLDGGFVVFLLMGIGYGGIKFRKIHSKIKKIR